MCRYWLIQILISFIFNSCSSFPESFLTAYNITSPFSSKLKIQYCVITGSEYHSRSRLIQDTWSKDLGIGSIEYITDSESNSDIKYVNAIQFNNTISMNANYKYRYSQLKWLYPILSFKYHSFDWLVLLDDDTFIIDTALRSLLSEYNSSQPYIIGKMGQGCNFLCGGAGFALSFELVSILRDNFASQLIHTFTISLQSEDHFYSDVILSHFIRRHHIAIQRGREEFKNFSPAICLNWYIKNNVSPSQVVSFHRIHNKTEYVRIYRHYYSANNDEKEI